MAPAAYPMSSVGNGFSAAPPAAIEAGRAASPPFVVRNWNLSVESEPACMVMARDIAHVQVKGVLLAREWQL